MSSNKKISTLVRLLQKTAQEAVIEPNEISKATADKMANDIYDKIFDEELAKLIGQPS